MCECVSTCGIIIYTCIMQAIYCIHVSKRCMVRHVVVHIHVMEG